MHTSLFDLTLPAARLPTFLQSVTLLGMIPPPRPLRWWLDSGAVREPRVGSHASCPRIGRACHGPARGFCLQSRLVVQTQIGLPTTMCLAARDTSS